MSKNVGMVKHVLTFVGQSTSRVRPKKAAEFGCAERRHDGRLPAHGPGVDLGLAFWLETLPFVDDDWMMTILRETMVVI